ncbi:RluA family pseudouridine synthase [Micavibrio aeruginosavorus]|uniref:RluA family pseudouridine synthase n=1 Tax=Micavibrio aeruginosavorus TaxID=349221 RepID=UPI003F4AB631
MEDHLADPIYTPPNDPVVIIYQDDDLLVVEKPSGLLHVPGKDPRLWDCLDVRVRKLFPKASIIHRLDRDTSGVVVMGLNKKAHAFIAAQFENRTAQKIYIARVWGRMDGEGGHINLPLGIDVDRKPRHRVDHDKGRSAQTDWEVIAREENATRVRLFPRTGRTHQLRVHMLAIGHPILGDAFYADGDALAAADRLQLHAEQLRFVHPSTGEECTFIAPCPF